MMPLRLSLTIDRFDTALTLSCVSALFSLAAAKAGASFAELERGTVAIAELVEVVYAHTPITEVVLEGFRDAFEITLYLAGTSALNVNDSSRQVIDGGLSTWDLRGDSVGISLPFDYERSDHEQ